MVLLGVPTATHDQPPGDRDAVHYPGPSSPLVRLPAGRVALVRPRVIPKEVTRATSKLFCAACRTQLQAQLRAAFSSLFSFPLHCRLLFPTSMLRQMATTAQ